MTGCGTFDCNRIGHSSNIEKAGTDYNSSDIIDYAKANCQNPYNVM